MARSSTIWHLKDTITNEPVAAFTVKHELKSWLTHCPKRWERLKLYRMADSPLPTWLKGAYDKPDVEIVSIPELMK